MTQPDALGDIELLGRDERVHSSDLRTIEEHLAPVADAFEAEPDALALPGGGHRQAATIPGLALVVMLRDATGLAEALRLPIAGHHDLVGECRLPREPLARDAFVLRVQFELPLAVERQLRPRRLIRGDLRDGDAQERDPNQGRVHDKLRQSKSNRSSWKQCNKSVDVLYRDGQITIKLDDKTVMGTLRHGPAWSAWA